MFFILLSILANWLFARWIENAPTVAKKKILITALIINIIYLCIFK
jgi:hypothetical protein